MAWPTQAATFNCFAEAKTSYELAYCEIKAKGKGRQLPHFRDFRKNNEVTQSLLLMRDAKALKIPLSKARPSLNLNQPHQPNQPARPSKKITRGKGSMVATQQADITTGLHSECSLQPQTIICPRTRFNLTGNLSNSRLPDAALSSQNLMALPNYRATEQNTDIYLKNSYTRYLEKMLEIGLGGVTMSFTKFHYLFYDMQRKKLDFSERFETMYRYLKLDKSQNAVSEATQDIAGIGIESCTRLNDRLVACDNVSFNRLYLKN